MMTTASFSVVDWNEKLSFKPCKARHSALTVMIILMFVSLTFRVYADLDIIDVDIVRALLRV
eukprot:1734614-Heterocapsa_arctica.AAC.1